MKTITTTIEEYIIREWTLSIPNTIGEGNEVYWSDLNGIMYDKERKTIYIIIITW